MNRPDFALDLVREAVDLVPPCKDGFRPDEDDWRATRREARIQDSMAGEDSECDTDCDTDCAACGRRVECPSAGAYQPGDTRPVPLTDYPFEAVPRRDPRIPP